MSFQEKDHSILNGRPLELPSTSPEAPQRKDRLSNSDILRYSRQLILPEIGVKGPYD